MLIYLLCTHGFGLILALIILVIFERCDVRKRMWFLLYKWYLIIVLPIVWFSSKDIRRDVNKLLDYAE